jgi:hypothetical protein
LNNNNILIFSVLYVCAGGQQQHLEDGLGQIAKRVDE